MSKNLKIGDGYSIPAYDYANQANAILGIREAGKTYSAMKIAEELLEAEIPILVFDPVGVWKNLKIGRGKHKGYPVVVAGGDDADIRLTKENAVNIVRAAMKENVSLIIDLYSPELINKSTWIQVVQSTVDLLMYENKIHSLRHIFIEEAAEFIPQRLQPQHSKVYASLERLARMGRNAKLGMTIINQRAEEVNKAILEICELSLIHRQVGKNSMLSIQKWLEIRQCTGVKDIIKSLPGLQKGQCWAIGMDRDPVKIQVSEKNTFHPNPKAKEDMKLIGMLKRDVGAFVVKLNQQLKEPDFKMVVPVRKGIGPDNSKELEDLRRENMELKKLLTRMEGDLKKIEDAAGMYKNHSVLLQEKLTEIGGIVARKYEVSKLPVITAEPKAVHVRIPSPAPVEKTPRPSVAPNGTLGKCSRAIIQFLGRFPEKAFTKPQVAIATGYSVGSGGFNNALSELNQKGYIVRGERLRVNMVMINEINEAVGGLTHQEYSIETYRENLGKCEREIYDVLLQHPQSGFTKEELSQRTETQYSPSSGGFNNALSRLNTLELIERSGGQIRLNPELLELM